MSNSRRGINNPWLWRKRERKREGRKKKKGKERKKKKYKRRVEEAARAVSVGNISRPCHFSNSGSCIPDIRAKCPRFSRVHSSDREADSVSINYAGRSPSAPDFYLFIAAMGCPNPPSTDERGKTVGWTRVGARELALWTVEHVRVRMCARACVCVGRETKGKGRVEGITRRSKLLSRQV